MKKAIYIPTITELSNVDKMQYNIKNNVIYMQIL